MFSDTALACFHNSNASTSRQLPAELSLSPLSPARPGEPGALAMGWRLRGFRWDPGPSAAPRQLVGPCLGCLSHPGCDLAFCPCRDMLGPLAPALCGRRPTCQQPLCPGHLATSFPTAWNSLAGSTERRDRKSVV